MAAIRNTIYGGLLIVLNGIEIRNNNFKKLLHITLLIVLNGIEISLRYSRLGLSKTFNRTKWN